MSIDSTQRGVARGMVLAIALAIGVFAVFYVLQWPHFTSEASLVPRLKLAALAGLAPAAILLLCIARLAKHRFATPDDMHGSALTEGTERAKLLQALLQNTLEQTVLAIPVYLAASLVLRERFLPLVAAAATLFVIGRIQFFRGYAKGAPSRAAGFGLTFYPSVALLLSVVAVALLQGDA
jgi:MAPEG family